MSPSRPHSIRVHAGAGDYFVVCRDGSIREASREVSKLGQFSSVHVVTSAKVMRALGSKVTRAFPRGRMHIFNDAESAKCLRSVEVIAQKLVRAGADRESLIIAVGGGVVGDVVGFVAASYLRGVALVQVPTTVVAQVDSSVGGKTGVNLPEGKNLVGAFYPPRVVLVDPELLASLPDREYRSGLAEVIKYGVISDAKLFGYLEENMERLLKRDRAALEYVIGKSIEAKARVVSKDERESGLREILNFGHTFAHALESVTRYKRYRHGEAVAWGMMCAALLGHEVAGTPADDVARIIALVRRIGPLPPWPSVAPKKLYATMHADKKTKFGKVRFVLSPRIGRATSYDKVSEQKAICVLRFGPRLAMQTGKVIAECS